MITLEHLAQQYVEHVTGGAESSDSDLDLRVIIFRIRQIVNQLLKAEYYSKYEAGDKSPITTAIATYRKQEIKKEHGEWYIDLPSFHLSLPYNKGIRQVSIDQKDRRTRHLTPRLQPMISFLCDVYDFIKNESYYAEGSKIYLGGDDYRDKTATIKLIVLAPDSVSETDPLPILPEMEAQILERLLSVQRYPQDTVNDNIDKPDTNA